MQLSTVNLIQRGAEFDDAGADGFYRRGERQDRGFIKEQDDAIKFAFAGAAGEAETDGMEEIAAADFELFLEFGDDLFETFGGERSGLEEKQCEMADDVAGRVTGERGVGVSGLENFGGVVVKDEAEEVAKPGGSFGVVAQELGSTFGPDGLLRSGIPSEPVIFVEKADYIVGVVGVNVDGVFGDVVFGRHAKSLAQEPPGNANSAPSRGFGGMIPIGIPGGAHDAAEKPYRQKRIGRAGPLHGRTLRGNLRRKSANQEIGVP